MDVNELAKIADPNDFSWIKVKRHTDDQTQSVESRLETLQEHHIKETTFLLNKCRELAAEILRNNHVKGQPGRQDEDV